MPDHNIELASSFLDGGWTAACSRGCPECGGELHPIDDSRDGNADIWWRCEDCDYTAEPDA